MIAYLRGALLEAGEDHAVIDVGGVGYLVQLSSATLGGLPGRGEAVELYVETQMREDAITLIGFASPAERSWFRLLVAIQGVGAKVALAILAALRPDALAAAVASRDTASLARAQGVGKKLASRICAELAEKVGALPQASAPALAAAPVAGGAPAPAPESGLLADAVSALANLGYARADAWRAARAAIAADPEADFASVVREALKTLSP